MAASTLPKTQKRRKREAEDETDKSWNPKKVKVLNQHVLYSLKGADKSERNPHPWPYLQESI